MKEIEQNLNGSGLRIGIVQSRFNPEVCEGLLGACRAQLVQQGVAEADILLATVPGALRAAATQETHPVLRWDPRSYGIGAQILRDLGVGKMRLLATPRKLPSMTGFGLEVVGYANHE